ncbi:MAG: alpha-galactosidase [Spirochaetes bacterium]|nr:alpha-galactosidase [Spirochaetota bacterium]
MAIIYLEEKRLFAISGDAVSYLFGFDERGLLKHLHWGRRVDSPGDFGAGFTGEGTANDPAVDILTEEYAPWGGMRFKEPCLKVSFADGTRDLVPVYREHRIRGDLLSVTFTDAHYPLELILFYRMMDGFDILERYAEIVNRGKEPFTIHRAASAEFHFPGTGWHQTNVYGQWAAEQRRFREPLGYGRKVLESRKGSTGHNHGPWFILDRNAGEEEGTVYFGALVYSGNFKTVFEVSPYGNTRVITGINDFDFAWVLRPGESFRTPAVLCGCTGGGFGAMSRGMHRIALKRLMPEEHRGEIRPVLYNSWEATYFDVTCQGQLALAETAAAMGVELFVVDDGWFGERHSDHAGLGDWYVNRTKFPSGLAPLVDGVKKLGMQFGIWVEPEMVNPDSDLYREHPEWIYRFEHREPTTGRNQLVLNLCEPAVAHYIVGVLSSLLSEHDIAFVKWDMNRAVSEPGALNLPPEDRQSVWYRHVLAFYGIVDELRRKFPRVVFEACASGGGRVDHGCLMRFDQFWTSDNTDALDRLEIQEGYSLMFPAKAMRAWVTDCPNFLNKRTIPLRYRFHSAMMGSLGIGGDLKKWSPQEREESAKMVAMYKEIRHVVQEGELYRLSTIGSGLAALQYVLSGESVVFALTRGERYGRELIPLRLRGLDRGKTYTVDIDGFAYDKSGGYLMESGITLHLPGDYASIMVRITEK